MTKSKFNVDDDDDRIAKIYSKLYSENSKLFSMFWRGLDNDDDKIRKASIKLAREKEERKEIRYTKPKKKFAKR